MVQTLAKCVVAALGLALLAGCGGKKEESITVTDASGQKTTITTTTEGDTATITTADGQFTAKSGEGLEVTLPSGVPSYPGAKAIATFSGGDATSQGSMVSLETADPVAKVVDFYKAEMAKAGYTSKAEMRTDQSAMLSYSKGEADNEAVQLIIGSGGEGQATTIQVMAGGQKER
jgi:hypothetical protein